MSCASYLTSPQFTEEDRKKEEASLTPEEKRRAEDDLYGRPTLTNTFDETDDEFVNDKLRHLREELEGIAGDDKVEFVEAKAKGAEFTDADDELLLFLRSAWFDCKAAAQRMVSYWKDRTKLFGPDRAFDPITEELLTRNKDDQYMLSMNVFTVLPGRDDFGRRLMMYNPSRTKLNYNHDSFVRAVWVWGHRAVRVTSDDDPRDPKRGQVIVIINSRGASVEFFDRSVQAASLTAMRTIFPMRLVASHWCYPPCIFEHVYPVFQLLMGKEFRIRSRLHDGPGPVVDKLAKFGIGREVLPREMGGVAVIPLDVPPVKRGRDDATG